MRAKTPFRDWVRRACKCVACGASGPDPDHLRSIGLGGTSDPESHDVENVVPLCRVCHTLRHDGNLGVLSYGEGGRPVYTVNGHALETWARMTWDRWTALPAETRQSYADWHSGDALAS